MVEKSTKPGRVAALPGGEHETVVGCNKNISVRNIKPFYRGNELVSVCLNAHQHVTINILLYVNKHGSVTIDSIHKALYEKYGYSERVIDETLFRMHLTDKSIVISQEV